MSTDTNYNVSGAEINRLLNSVNRRPGYSKHAIMDIDGIVYDHFTKPSKAVKKERNRRKERAARQARKANW